MLEYIHVFSNEHISVSILKRKDKIFRCVNVNTYSEDHGYSGSGFGASRSNNSLTSVDGLDGLEKLENLNISRNKFCTLADLNGVRAAPRISSLDVRERFMEGACTNSQVVKQSHNLYT